jgi:hypothetical protein
VVRGLPCRIAGLTFLDPSCGFSSERAGEMGGAQPRCLRPCGGECRNAQTRGSSQAVCRTKATVNYCTSPSLRISRYELLFLVTDLGCCVQNGCRFFFSRASQLGTTASATSIVAKTASVSSTCKPAPDGVPTNGRQVYRHKASC